LRFGNHSPNKTDEIINLVALIGFNKGKSTLKNIPIVLTPIIPAASSSFFGTVERIKPKWLKWLTA